MSSYHSSFNENCIRRKKFPCDLPLSNRLTALGIHGGSVSQVMCAKDCGSVMADLLVNSCIKYMSLLCVQRWRHRTIWWPELRLKGVAYYVSLDNVLWHVEKPRSFREVLRTLEEFRCRLWWDGFHCLFLQVASENDVTVSYASCILCFEALVLAQWNATKFANVNVRGTKKPVLYNASN